MKLIKWIGSFFRSLFKCKLKATEWTPKIKKLVAIPAKTFDRRNAKETRSLLLKLREGMLLFTRDGSCLTVIKTRLRHKKVVFARQENGRIVKLVMAAFERRYVDTEPLC